MTQNLPSAGSNRQYIRVFSENGQSIIHVEGTNKDENHAFITLARHFASKGLPVPHILSVAGDEMSYEVTDLGDISLFDAIKNGRETGTFDTTEKELLKKTIRALAHIQIEGAQDLDWSVCFPVPTMDIRSIFWDLNYFKYCFLKGTKIEFSEPKLEAEFERLADRLIGSRASASVHTQTFLYRDFQSRNVMIVNGEPYFIDFQGGRRGPVYYDLASFLWQAKAGLPDDLREELLQCYQEELGKISDIRFDRDTLNYFVLFRLLQVLGAYGYRGYFERKEHFLASIPAALKNLKQVLDSKFRNEFPYLLALSETLIASLLDSRGTDSIESSSTSLPLYSSTPLLLTIYSFSYKRGIPEDETGNGGGYVFDCRSTHNPGKYKEFSEMTGLDTPVIEFLEKDGEITTFLQSVWALTDHHIMRFIEREFTHLQIAFGCTGGQHRSVYCAERTAEHIRQLFPNVTIHLIHRERGIDKVL